MESNVTQILNRINTGDQLAIEELLNLVHLQLQRIAVAKLNAEAPNNSLQTADLVNEAYIRLLGTDAEYAWRDRGHFFGAAAEAMRRILVEQARKKHAAKRGGGSLRVELNERLAVNTDRVDEILSVHSVLDELEELDATAARLVKLRYFASMEHKEAADAMGITRGAADHLWKKARNWLYRRLKEEE